MVGGVTCGVLPLAARMSGPLRRLTPARTRATMPTWFSNAFGFKEGEYYETQEQLAAMFRRSGERLFLGDREAGEWHFKSVKEQRKAALAKLKAVRTGGGAPRGPVKIQHHVADVRGLHSEYPGCMFQAASQFNCLEFVSPKQVPEHGITGYRYDRTQGPACAMACPAGTAFRNYLVECNGESGQTAANQLDGLEDLGQLLRNEEYDFWRMRNGYLDSSDAQLANLNKVLAHAEGTGAYKMYRDAIRIGVHYNTQVEGEDQPNTLVGQAYCAAPAINYSRGSTTASWERFSRLILEASYEATLWATINNHDFTDPEAVPTVFLTKVGGGVFGNEASWIIGAIETAAKEFQRYTKQTVAMNLVVVHYGNFEAPYPKLLTDARIAYTPPPANGTPNGSRKRRNGGAEDGEGSQKRAKH